jgi:hypothetical protein
MAKPTRKRGTQVVKQGNVQASFSLQIELHRALRILAAKRGCTMSVIVSETLAKDKGIQEILEEERRMNQ